MSKRPGTKRRKQRARPVIEGLEPRILLSADLPGLDTLASGNDETEHTDVDQVLADLDAALNTTPNPEPPVLDPAADDAEPQRRELIIVDAGVPDYQQLLDGVLAGGDASTEFRVVVLAPDRDGVDQLNDLFATYQGLDAVHLLSHGSEGAIHVGDGTLDLASLQQQQAAVSEWGQAFNDNGDFLIYGCDLAGSEQGTGLVDTLAQLTGTDVAASDDPTGHGALGGDWDLEYHQGVIDTAIAFNETAQATWSSTLGATTTVTTTSDANDAGIVQGNLSHTIAWLDANKGTDGEISLREAIIAANNTVNGGTPDRIEFNIAEPLVSGMHTINVGSAFQDIAHEVIIDGWSNPDHTDRPIVRIDGTGSGQGLRFGADSDNSLVRGLIITNFADGILVEAGADYITIQGNWVGTTGTGSTGVGNTDDGLDIRGSNAQIGGTGANEGNVITNSGDEGVDLRGSGVTAHTIEGNIIGLDPDGASGSGNADVGIAIISGSGNTIGGTTDAARNVISNNFEGIEINTNDNIVQGNYIGTDFSGTKDRGNRSDDGVELQGGVTGNIIGGSVDGAGNIISSNAGYGIHVKDAPGTVIQGNIVGSGVSGSEDLGNSLTGIYLNGSNAAGIQVGGLQPGEGNLIAYNLQRGVYAVGTGGSDRIEGNVIRDQDLSGILSFRSGTTIAGNLVYSNSTTTTFDEIAIGDNQVVHHNTIHGAAGDGISVEGVNAVIQNNIVTGSAGYGIRIAGGSISTESHNLITDAVTGPANLGGQANFALDPTTVNADPQFVNAGADNFSLTSGTSPAIDNGLDLGGAQPDMNAAGAGLYDGAAPDIGAFEDGTNIAPMITSDGGGRTAAIGVPENTTLVTTVTATELDGGDTLTYSIIGGLDKDQFIVSNTGVLTFSVPPDFEAPADYDGDNVYEVIVEVDDGNGGRDTQAIFVTVSGDNDAPVLAGANDLAAIDEDPVSNAGTLVSALISGQISDDAGDPSGIAIIAVDDTNGTWQYTTNGGSNWFAFGAVDASTARLLAADANTSVRFVPDSDWNGTVSNGITFHAWDQTSGAAGGTVDINTNFTVRDEFATASYSNSDGTVAWATDWQELGEADGPSLGDVQITGAPAALRIGGPGMIDGDGALREVDLSQATSATLTFDAWCSAYRETAEVTISVSDDGGSNWTDLQTLQFSTLTSTPTLKSFDISAHISANTQIRFLGSGEADSAYFYADNVHIDGGATGGASAFSTATAASSITVDAVNDDPSNSGSLPTDVTVLEGVSSGIDLSAVNFADPDHNNQLLTVTLSTSTGGRLFASTDIDVIVSGSGGPVLTLTGGINDLNTFFDSPARIQYLHSSLNTAGDNADTIQVEIRDNGNTGSGGGGTIDLGTVNVDITNVNDAPSGTDKTVTTLEDTDYAFTATDFGFGDVNDSPSDSLAAVVITTAPANGTLYVDANGDGLVDGGEALTATDTVSIADITAGRLKFKPVADANGTGYDSFTFQVRDDGGTANSGVDTDPTANTITIDVTADNDAPNIGGVDTGVVTEDVGVVGGFISTSGSLTITDPDVGESSFQAATVNGTYGDLTIDTAGNWSYAADNTQAAIQRLDVGETLNDVLTVTSADGTTHDITVTINGAEDAPDARPDGVYLSFDGDDMIRVADHASLQMTNTVSMEAWINHNGTGTGSQLVVNKEGEYELGITADTGEIKFAIARSDNTWAWHDTGYFVTAGQWTHVAVTYDGVAGQAHTYVNGQLVDTLSQSGVIGDVYTGFNDLTIGGRENASNQRFEGLIDDVRVWNTARTQLDIQSNMYAPLLGTEPGLAGNWQLNEAFGTTALDQTASGNHGVLGGVEGAGATPSWQGYFVSEDAMLSVPALTGLLANDFDIDGETLSVTNVDSTGMIGTLIVNPVDGSFTYDPRGVMDSLDVGERLTETFTYTANDGSSDSSPVTVSITVIGAEDTPVITGTTAGSVTEDGTLTANGTLSISDVDTSDNPISFPDEASTPGDNGFGSFQLVSGTWTYTLNNTHPAVQALDSGETLTDTHTFTASDSSTQVVTITIHGAEDAPVITGTTSGNVTEDGTLTANGTLSISDVDNSDNPISFPDEAATPGDNGYGSFALTGGTWSYTLNNAHPAVQALDAGETLTDTHTFLASDSTPQVVTITIHGAEDAPVVTGTTAGNVTEDGTVTANGTLSISDVDTSDNPISFPDEAATPGDNGYGSFALTGGTWSYTLNNAHASVQALDAGETLTDTHTFLASDGTSQVVSITIHGAEDAPVVTGTTAGNVTEDGTLTANGTLSISDADTSDNPISFPDEVATPGDNGFGSFALTGGTWSYTLNNAHASVQALDAGETLTDTHTFLASDGTSQVVTITIHGAEDTPVISGTTAGNVTEDGTVTANGTLSISDVDTSDNPISFPDEASTPGDNGYGSFQLVSGTWTYTLNNAHPAVQALDAGETLTDTHTFLASDSTPQVVTITIHGAEDTPVISGTTAGNVTEDGTLTANGTLSISDVDTSDNPISFPDEASTPGDNGFGSFALSGGTWSYTLNNAHPAVQALDTGETLTDTHTFTASDSSIQVVTITIHGAEDTPVITGTTGGSVTEDGTLTANGTLSISDVDTSDNPISFPDEAATPGDNGYGSFALTGGTWSYTLNNAHPAVQALDAGETLTDTHAFTASDGTTQTVTMTISSSEPDIIEIVIDPPPPPEVIEEPVDEPDPEEEGTPTETPEEGETRQETSEPEPADADTGPVAVAQEIATDMPPAFEPDAVILSVIANPAPAGGADDAGKPAPTAKSFLSELKSAWQDEPAPEQILEIDFRNAQDGAFWRDLEQMSESFDRSAEEEQKKIRVTAEAAAGVSLSLTAGFVSWALRAGSMVASFLAAMPTWRNFDPLPILAAVDKARRDAKQEDEEHSDDASKADNDEAAVDDLFDR